MRQRRRRRAADANATGVLAVVTSPLQLLHAAEALERLGLERAAVRLTVLAPREPVAVAQLRAVWQDDPWPDTQWLDAPGAAGKYAFLRREAASAPEVLVIGEYRLDLLRELANRSRTRRVVLVDDGNATRLVAHRREARRAGHGAPPARLAGTAAVRERLHRVAGVRGTDPAAVTYCTIYDLAVTAPDTVVRHRYERLRRRHPPPSATGPAVFLGSNLVESGVLPEHAYRDLVAAAVASEPRPELYLPHRRESDAKVATLAAQLGMAVRRPPVPVELDLAAGATRPARVYATVSSTLDTLAVLFDGALPLCALLPDETVVAPPARASFAALTGALRAGASAGVEIVDVVGGGRAGRPS
jgi:hypothetical protein